MPTNFDELTDFANKAHISLGRLPRVLSKGLYEGLMWDASMRTITNAHKVTLREVLLYMVGASKMSEAMLLAISPW